MKRFLKLFVLLICFFSVLGSVNAETGNYKPGTFSYCFTQDGSYGKKVDGQDTSCSGYYGGTVYKQIDGQDAYCVQGHVGMSRGSKCTVATYNQYDWMNGKWTENRAIRLGYMIQYIQNQNLSKAQEYVYIVNGSNQLLRFDGSFPSRELNSTIQAAIDYANQQVKTYKKVSTTTPVTAAFTSDVLTNVNNSYATGIVNVSLTNGSYGSNMTVSAVCNGCTLYTDKAMTKVYGGTTLKASESQNLQLFVKTNDYKENSDVSVKFSASYGSITYPIGKVWDCGTDKQALATVDKVTFTPEGGSVTVASKVPAIKRVCQIYDNNYYGMNGTIVTESQYRDECMKICKVEGNTFYGINGKAVDEATYKDECLKVCKIDGNTYYGKDGKKVDEATYKDQCTTPVCAVRNGEYYGKNGTKVNESTYRDECLKICKVENGKYYGSNGEEVTADRYKAECTKTCIISDGKYYGSNGNVVSEAEYKAQCTNPVCGIRNGKYYGLNATEVSESVYRSQCLTSVNVPVESTGTHSSTAPIVGGSLLITFGIGSIIYSKKKENM